MRHFNFETNIQERMPQTGKVFYVKRMTADYAECYPFDVDGFIEDIYQKYQQVAAEDPTLAAWAKTREELRQQWVKTLSVTRKSGDATIYPNRDGRQEPALMEVWHKAGDYWRAGLRIGDMLPKIVPPCRITRLEEGGWIALFPKEMHLLEESTLQKIDEVEPESNVNDACTIMTQEPQELSLFDADDERNTADAATDAHDSSEPSVRAQETETEGEEATDQKSTAAYHSGAPLPCGLTEEQEATEMIASAASDHGVSPEPDTEGTGTSAPSADDGTARMEPAPAVPRSQREILAERRHQRRLERERMQRSYEERMEREAREAEQAARDEERRKIFAAVGAVAVTAVMIYFFGLLGPAVFGLLCGGLLKG